MRLFETPNSAEIAGTTGLITSRAAIVAKKASVHAVSTVRLVDQPTIYLTSALPGKVRCGSTLSPGSG
jgi:hypothetical protein